MIRRRRRGSGRSLVPLLIYLSLFTMILLLVCHEFLLPAMVAANGADARGRLVLATYARLVLLILLIILLGLLMLSLRTGPAIRRRSADRVKPTEYPDAWAESGKRLELHEDDSPEDSQPDDSQPDDSDLE